jgi:excisionase family DNA binding protein
MVTTAELAAVCRMNPVVVRRKCKDGSIPATKVGTSWLIPRAYVEAVARGEAPPATGAAQQQFEPLYDDTLRWLKDLAANARPLTATQKDAIRAVFAEVGGDTG